MSEIFKRRIDEREEGTYQPPRKKLLGPRSEPELHGKESVICYKVMRSPF